MPWVLHWKATAAMTAAYVALAAVAILLIKDPTAQFAVLMLGFFGILFIGNVVVRKH